jgi:G3E family GTPase
MTPRAEAERAPIPLTVIGGFLGAGKTTLVNAMLAQARGRRLAIQDNDSGALSIDAALISGRDARTISLANGCVCCTLVNGLVQALLDVLAMDPPPDHVVVEASGVGDPRRIAHVARADRAFAQDLTLVVVAADQVEALARDRYVGDTVLRQIAGADLIVLNRIDLVGGAQAAATSAWLATVAPHAHVVRAVNAELPADLVLGPLPVQSRRDEPSYMHRSAEHGDTFASRTLRCANAVSESAMRQALAALPDAVLRAKGFVRFDTAADTVQLVQVVGRRCSIAPAPPGVSTDGSVLVLVGAAEAMNRADLRDLERVFVEPRRSSRR